MIPLGDDMRLSARLAGVDCQCLLDTGSSISLLHKTVFDAMPNLTLRKTSVQARTASLSELPLLGRTVVPIDIAGVKCTVPFFVSEATDVPCLLGVDFLQHCPCVIDLRSKQLFVTPTEVVRSVSAHAVSIGDVCLNADRVVAPGTEMILNGFVPHTDYHGPALVEPGDDDLHGLEVVGALVTVAGSKVPVVVRNVTAEPITIPKKKALASLEVGFVEQPHGVGDQSSSASGLQAVQCGSDLTAEQKGKLESLLKRHAEMFDGHVGFTDLVTHEIDTGDHPPIRQPPRRVPPHLSDELRSQILDLVKQGILEESDGEWSSPICLVKKKSGAFRLVADLRRLNAVSMVPVYQIPRVDDSLEALAGSDTFCQLDMNSAYFQVAVNPRDRDKTTIATPFGTYRYTRMVFGLAGAPATCARLLDIVLGDLTPRDCVHYFDDIIVHGRGFDDVMAKLEKVLQRFESAGLTLNLQKCSFFAKSVNFLGHVVSAEGVSTDPQKVQKVVEWPCPRTQKELSSFLGLASYFRKYVKNFAEIAAPLFRLTQKDTKFEWTDTTQSAFDRLKDALSTAPVVSFPRFTSGAGRFRLDTDASDLGIGATLFQEQDGEDRVIAYASQKLSKSQRNYSTTRKELLACVVFTQHFRHYLLGKRFELNTDHASLRWLMTFKNPTGILARWFEILSGFDFDVVYRPGAENVPADVMSRCPQSRDVETQTDEHVRTVSPSAWSYSFLRHEQDQDSAISEIARHLSVGIRPRSSSVSPETVPLLRQWHRLRVIDGVVFRCFRSRPGGDDQLQLVVPQQLIAGVLTSMHAGPAGGHFGAESLTLTARREFWWPGMEACITEFCSRCVKCNTRATPVPRPRASMGELYSDEPFETISIDFLCGLPTTARGNKHLLVVCDHFTRWCEVFPVPDMSAVTVADVIVNQFIARFGCPRRIHSDNAANFSGSLLTEVCRMLGVEKSFSSAFHPEGNSKCERMMRTILDMLAKYLDANHAEWDVHLPLLMLGYRAKVHSSLGHSPYYLMFGREPRLPASVQLQVPSTAPKSVTVSDYLSKLTERIKLSHKVALEASNRRHARNKRLFDKKLTTYNFQEGDSVYLFRSVAKSGEYYKFIRPWKPAVIVKKLSELNYRVRVLGGKKSVVVHHNRLKPRDDLSAPVAAPDVSVPSSAVMSPSPDAGELSQCQQSPSPLYAALGGDSYLPPSRSGEDERFAARADSDGEGESPSVSRASPDVSDSAGEAAGPQSDSAAPDAQRSVAPMPALRRSERVTRPPHRYCP